MKDGETRASHTGSLFLHNRRYCGTYALQSLTTQSAPSRCYSATEVAARRAVAVSERCVLGGWGGKHRVGAAVFEGGVRGVEGFEVRL
jgi:hypothetical protein